MRPGASVAVSFPVPVVASVCGALVCGTPAGVPAAGATPPDTTPAVTTPAVTITTRSATASGYLNALTSFDVTASKNKPLSVPVRNGNRPASSRRHPAGIPRPPRELPQQTTSNPSAALKPLDAVTPAVMLQADTQSGLDRLLQYGFVLRAVLAAAVLAVVGWAIVSTWDNPMGNVLFAILVTSAGVIVLIVLGVLASNLFGSG